MAQVIKHETAPVEPPPVVYDILGLTQAQYDHLSSLCSTDCAKRSNWTHWNNIFSGRARTMRDL